MGHKSFVEYLFRGGGCWLSVFRGVDFVVFSI